MNRFKKLVCKLSRLPYWDQQWVLRHFNAEQSAQFKKLRGDFLLQDAQRFRKIPIALLEQLNHTIQIPEVAQKLRHKDPLYSAIILDQGQFSWTQVFLATFECDRNQAMNPQVNALKPATKLYTFQQWQLSLSFHDQLEIGHG